MHEACVCVFSAAPFFHAREEERKRQSSDHVASVVQSLRQATAFYSRNVYAHEVWLMTGETQVARKFTSLLEKTKNKWNKTTAVAKIIWWHQMHGPTPETTLWWIFSSERNRMWRVFSGHQYLSAVAESAICNSIIFAHKSFFSLRTPSDSVLPMPFFKCTRNPNRIMHSYLRAPLWSVRTMV